MIYKETMEESSLNSRLIVAYVLFCVSLIFVSVNNMMAVKLLLILFLLGAFLYVDRLNKLCSLMLFLPYINIITIPGLSFSIFTILTIIYIFSEALADVWFKRETFILLAILVALKSLNIGVMGFNVYIAWIIDMCLLVAIFRLKPSTDQVDKVLMSYVLGVLSSSIISLATRIIYPNNNMFTKNLSAVVGHFDLSMLRFSGFMYDPNYYAQSALIAISIAFILLRKKQAEHQSTKLITLIIIACIGFGFYSYSKMFMGVITILLILQLAITAKKRLFNFAQILSLLLFFLIVFAVLMKTGIGETYLHNIAARIDPNDITTGRFGIVEEAIKVVLADYRPLLTGLGVGIAIPKYFGRMLHNTYLETVFSFGLLGTCIYVVFLINGLRFRKPSGSILDILLEMTPLLIFLLTSLALDGLWADWYYAYIGLFYLINRRNEPAYE